MSDGMIELYETAYIDLKMAKHRIKELEEAMSDFCEDMERYTKDQTEQEVLSGILIDAGEYYTKFKRILGGQK